MQETVLCIIVCSVPSWSLPIRCRWHPLVMLLKISPGIATCLLNVKWHHHHPQLRNIGIKERQEKVLIEDFLRKHKRDQQPLLFRVGSFHIGQKPQLTVALSRILIEDLCNTKIASHVSSQFSLINPRVFQLHSVVITCAFNVLGIVQVLKQPTHCQNDVIKQ